MAHGGTRTKAGRPKGSRSRKTLEKAAVQEAFNQRVLKQADELFNAQLALATGGVQIFQVNLITKASRLVSDPDEIQTVLDGNIGDAGVVGKDFYRVIDVLPDNKAIESMLNRALGKPKDSVDVTTNGKDLPTTQIVIQGVPGNEPGS